MAVDLIRQECPALEPSEDEDGGELELSLGLPIVGSSRRSAADLGIPSFSSWPSSSPTAPTLPSLLLVDGAEYHAPDPLRRREMRARRSHGTRRKRDEKQQGKGIRRAREDAAAAGAVGVNPELGPVAKQRKQNLDSVSDYPTLIPDSAAKPKAAVGVNPELGPVPKQRKRNLDSMPDYPTLIPAPKANPDSAANPNPKLTHPFPVIAMQYPYPPMQYMPFGDGFGVPFMMPCWAPAVSPVAEGPKPATARNVFQPVACRVFRPAVEPANGSSPARTSSVKSKDGSGAGIGRASSRTPSHGSSSSQAASDHRSGSAGSLPTVQPGNQDASSRQIGPGLGGAEEPPERRSTTSGDGPTPAAAARGSSPPPPIPPPRPRMPCVSATGDGPSGKRITGFLYRYTEAEISIVCVCHGSSFSPAEFVKHAGGTDAAHPLRQITVVSS